MDPVVAGLIGSLVSTAVVGGTAAIIKLRNNYNNQKRKDEATILQEHKQLIAELRKSHEEVKADLEEERKLHKETAEREANCNARFARAEERIQFIEDILKEQGFKFRPYNPHAGPGSGTMPILSQQLPKEESK